MYITFAISKQKMRNGYFFLVVFSKRDFISMLILIQHHKLSCLNLANEKSKVKKRRYVYPLLK